MQIKKMTNRQSTEDITNKRCDIVENTSMVFINFNFFILKQNNNLSDIYDLESEEKNYQVTEVHN